MTQADPAACFAALPEQQRGFAALYASLYTLEAIPARVLELCRLRIAQLHRCSDEWQRESHPVLPAQREHLAAWPDHPAFSAAERACLGLCEVYTADPQAITDEQADAVKTHFGEAGFVALAEAMGIFYGLARLQLLGTLPAAGAPE